MLRSLSYGFKAAKNLAAIFSNLSSSTRMAERKRGRRNIGNQTAPQSLICEAHTMMPRGKKVKVTQMQSISSKTSEPMLYPITPVPLSEQLIYHRERRERGSFKQILPDNVSKQLFESTENVETKSVDVTLNLALPKSELLADEAVEEPQFDDVAGGEWSSLGVGRDELDLSLTLPTGQTFRWRQAEDGTWSGVVGDHIVSLRQTTQDVLFRIHPSTPLPQPPSPPKKRKARQPVSSCKAEAAADSHTSPCISDADRARIVSELRELLNMDAASLSELYKGFSAADSRFAALSAHLGGARMLRQDPLECLFSFICSSNNHISRITGMVDHLSQYGDCLGSLNGHTFHKFPTLEQLAAADEATLRKAGFGYRAKFIEGTVKELLTKPEGGHQWLLKLRTVSLEEAVAELISLPGIGPKVARCIALFSLDKHHCIPVDTHVWQLAIRYYTPELEGKSLTPRVHQAVADAFVKVFGPYAGWAHNILFIAELASMRGRLPLHLHPPETPKKAKKGIKNAKLGSPEIVVEQVLEKLDCQQSDVTMREKSRPAKKRVAR